MIIVGYQGIGKSTIAGKDNCIDLESGNFWVDGKRSDDWYKPYCQIAIHLSEQGYNVFVSSHEVVRKELEKSEEGIVIIYPSLTLKDEWIDKLEKRYRKTLLDKDYKAWKNAEDRYEEDIKELSKFNIRVLREEICSMDYDLLKIINDLNRNIARIVKFFTEFDYQTLINIKE